MGTSPEPLMTNTAESIISNSIFNLTDRLPIFSYLVTSNRVHWYRVIMRTFFQRHRESVNWKCSMRSLKFLLS
jgi:hypothetical protein